MRTEASEIQVNLVFCCSAHESSHSIFEDIVDTDQFRWVFVARIACRTAHLSLPLLQGKWPIVKNDALMRNHRVVRTSTWKEESLQSTTGLAIPMSEEYFLPLHSHVTEDVTSAKKRLLHRSWEGA